MKKGFVEEKVVLEKDSFVNRLESMKDSDPNLVLSWLSGLTDLEQKVVSVLYKLNRAETIKIVRIALVGNTYWVSQLRTSDYDFPFQSYYPVPNNEILKMRELSTQEEKTNRILEIIAFPSFRRIEKTLIDLEKLGVVLRRREETENKKIKGLFFLNPFIRAQLNKVKKL